MGNCIIPSISSKEQKRQKQQMNERQQVSQKQSQKIIISKQNIQFNQHENHKRANQQITQVKENHSDATTLTKISKNQENQPNQIRGEEVNRNHKKIEAAKQIDNIMKSHKGLRKAFQIVNHKLDSQKNIPKDIKNQSA